MSLKLTEQVIYLTNKIFMKTFNHEKFQLQLIWILHFGKFSHNAAISFIKHIIL